MSATRDQTKPPSSLFRTSFPRASHSSRRLPVPGAPPTISGGTVTAVIGSLAAGSAATVLITVQPTTLPGSTLVDTASVSSPEFDADPGNKTASISVPVRNVSNLAVTMTPSTSSVPIGQTLGYTITVSNLGPAERAGRYAHGTAASEMSLWSLTHRPKRLEPAVTQGMISADLGRAGRGRHGHTHPGCLSPSFSLRPADDVGPGTGLQRRYRAGTGRGFATVNIAGAAGLSIAITPQSTPAHQAQDLSYMLTVKQRRPFR